MPYSRYYPGGWQDAPSTATPIIAAALAGIENGIATASQWYNVASYGAVGDGSADDTAAIQAALDAASAASSGLAVTGAPGSTYKVTAPLVMPPGVVLDGGAISDSYGLTLKPSAAFKGSAVIYGSDATASDGPAIRNVYIDGSSLPGGLAFTAATSGSLFTAAGSAFTAGQFVTLSGASLPGGFAATTATVLNDYYVLNPSGTTFQLSEYPGGTAITVTSSGSGTVTPRTDGIRFYGNVHAPILASLHIYNMSGQGLGSVWNPVSGGLPNAYHARQVVISSCALTGIAIPYASDSSFIDCYVIGNHGNGWRIQSVDNTHFAGCRAEWNDGYGFYLTGSWYEGHSDSTSMFAACATDRNNLDGLRIDATGHSPVIFTGCSFRRDGANGGSGGGSYAGVAVVGASGGATLPVIIAGCVVTPGVGDDGTGTNSPQYGFRATAAPTSVTVDSSYLWGNTAGISDDASAGLFYGAGVTTASGALASPTVNASPRLYRGSGAPSFTAAQGSLYLRSDGSSGSTRAYINTNGSTGWTAVTTAA